MSVVLQQAGKTKTKTVSGKMCSVAWDGAEVTKKSICDSVKWPSLVPSVKSKVFLQPAMYALFQTCPNF